MTFIIRSGSGADRNGYRTNQKGWHIDDFMRNPVVLWAHDQSSLPLGKCTRLWKDGEQLKGEVEFTPAGEIPFNDTVYNLLLGGFLNAASAGWAPIDYEFVDMEDGGWEIAFKEMDLLEFSIVPVPADPGALRQAAAAGIDIGPVRAWAQKLLDEPRYIVTVPPEIHASPDRLKPILERFSIFYPAAKVMVVPEGVTVTPLPNTETLPLRTMTSAQLDAETESITTTKTETDSACTSAADSPTEARSAGLPLDWYRCQLEVAMADEEIK